MSRKAVRQGGRDAAALDCARRRSRCGRPLWFRLRVAALACLAIAQAPASAAPPEPAIVELRGASRATGCAEEDNVSVDLLGTGIAGMRIEALHPVYLDRVAIDSTAPDFSQCDISDARDYRFRPRTVRLFEGAGLRLVGHTFDRFWRPEAVPLVIDGREEHGLHLVQLFVPWRGGWIETLVLYPADGYWRARPLPPPHLAETAYGSSFLIGPVEDAGRPMVALARIEFVPQTCTFHLRFARGGEATLQVVEVGSERLDLDVRFLPGTSWSGPFATLRSMFVTPQNADVARVEWQVGPEHPWRSLPILDLGREHASLIRYYRREPSRHNTSAPDLQFGPFYQESPDR